MYTSFGDRILLLRKKQKLTLEQLAQKVGIQVKELSDYEGDDAFPPFNIALKLADVLDISLDFLACRIDEQVDNKWLALSSEIQKMTEQNQDIVLELIEAFIGYEKVKNIYSKG